MKPEQKNVAKAVNYGLVFLQSLVYVVNEVFAFALAHHVVYVEGIVGAQKAA